MFNNLRSAIRSVAKQRLYSAINIAGLTIGLSACLLVATVVVDDLSYDRDWKRSDDIYRIVSVNKMGDDLYERMASSFAGLPPELKKLYPEVESYAPLVTGSFRLKTGDSDENGVELSTLSSDSAVWELLDLKILRGNPKKFVAGQSNLVISETIRKKYFGNIDPVGSVVYDVPSYGSKPKEYLITGVIADIPGNTHLRADVIRIDKRRAEELNKKQWGSFGQHFILLKPGTDVKNLTAKINKWYAGFVEADKPYQFELQSIKNVYLDSDFATYQKVKGSRQNIYIFAGVAILLLLIACLNFINLSTARSVTRLRDTAVRKVLGASRYQVIKQFLQEAMVIFVVSTILAVMIYQLSLGPIESFLGHQLERTILSQFALFAIAIGAIMIVGILTGLYPAWLITGTQTASSLKGNLFSNTVNGQGWLRKSLVVVQFSISIVVLLAMIIVQQQLGFMDKADIGYDKSNLLAIDHVSWDGKGGSFRNELAALKGVENASISSWLPSNGAGYMSREIDDPEHPGNKVIVWYITGDINLAKTMGLRLSEGRLLSSEYGTDAMNEDSLSAADRKKFNELSEIRPAVLTATTARLLHMQALNQKIPLIKVVPVGIIQDFHNQSFHEKLGPTVITAESNPQYGGMLVRVSPGSAKQVTVALNKLWRKFYPDKLLGLRWVDEMLAKQYESENKLKQLFSFFSLLTMILASLGIFGLVVHASQQRVKEIGVRKVLGASVASIFRLLSGEFVVLVAVALLISSPVAWYLMNRWLENFSYRIDIPWWAFAVAGIATVATALITVSFQSIKAAMVNPVESLKNGE